MSLNYKTTSAIGLQNIIKQLGPSLTGVELGVWYGTNMGHLLEECPNIKTFIGIDPYIPYQDWNRYIDQGMMDSAYNSAISLVNQFPDRAHLLKLTSLEASKKLKASKVFDFIFIDGDHSFERCYEDITLWYDTVRKGGLFSGHDFSLPGVNRAINKFRKERNIIGFFKVIPNDVWYWIKD